MKRIAILSLVIVFLGMTGCAQPNMTDSQRTKAEGTGVGVLAGAAIGAMVGGRQGAVLGAALGGAAGFAWGSHVADQKAKYARKEDWLNACIADAKTTNKETRKYNASLRKKISETKKLVRQYKKNKVSKFSMMTANLSLKYEKNQAESKIKSIGEDIEAQKRARKSAKGSQRTRLNNEIARMRKERNELKRNTKTLAKLVVQTSV